MRNKFIIGLFIGLFFSLSATGQLRRVWFTLVQDSLYAYPTVWDEFPPPRNVVFTVENAFIKGDSLKFRINLYNQDTDTVTLLKLERSIIDIEFSSLIIMLYPESGHRIRYETGINAQLSAYAVLNPLRDVVKLAPQEGYYTDYVVNSDDIKYLPKGKYSIQLILDYEYTIASVIPLCNVIQQVLISNFLEIRRE